MKFIWEVSCENRYSIVYKVYVGYIGGISGVVFLVWFRECFGRSEVGFIIVLFKEVGWYFCYVIGIRWKGEERIEVKIIYYYYFLLNIGFLIKRDGVYEGKIKIYDLDGRIYIKLFLVIFGGNLL